SAQKHAASFNMSEASIKAPSLPARALRLVTRLVVIGFTVVVFTWAIPRLAGRTFDVGTKPGFARGIVHGALMPLALPQLLLGRDVIIYSVENTGRAYKLGYTAGVNGCGAVSFGVIFWRWSRWRKRRVA